MAADVTNAILKMHAEKGKPAEYWDKNEQEERLTSMYNKWARKGTIWSAAAQKVSNSHASNTCTSQVMLPPSCQVHQEQLKHVRKGCLTRRRQDIRSDGSRIEGSHKGWNSIQRAQPSGIVMLNALLNDFVLRRNLRIAQQKHSPTPFIVSSHGSHHLALINSIAITHNKLKQSGSNVQVDVLPILPDVPSGEVFGLMKSDYLTTFNGLIEVKQEVPDADFVPADDPQSTGMNSLDFANNEVADLALRASRAVLFDEWQIDPALLEQPQSSSTTTSLCTVARPTSIGQPMPTTNFECVSEPTINGHRDEALSLPTDSRPSKQLQMAPQTEEAHAKTMAMVSCAIHRP